MCNFMNAAHPSKALSFGRHDWFTKHFTTHDCETASRRKFPTDYSIDFSLWPWHRPIHMAVSVHQMKPSMSS
jgi:hypothetical protein